MNGNAAARSDEWAQHFSNASCIFKYRCVCVCVCGTAGVSQGAVERHSPLRSSAVARAHALRQQRRLLHAALVSSNLLPSRPSLQRPRRMRASIRSVIACLVSNNSPQCQIARIRAITSARAR